MRIRNFSHLPDATVFELVKFACSGVDMRRVMVCIEDFEPDEKWGLSGMAYLDVPQSHPASRMKSVDHLVQVKIGRKSKFPLKGHKDRRLKSLPAIDIRDPKEALVYVTAHEAMHVWQHKNGQNLSERQAEVFAHEAIKVYRYSHQIPRG